MEGKHREVGFLLFLATSSSSRPPSVNLQVPSGGPKVTHTLCHPAHALWFMPSPGVSFPVTCWASACPQTA